MVLSKRSGNDETKVSDIAFDSPPSQRKKQRIKTMLTFFASILAAIATWYVTGDGQYPQVLPVVYAIAVFLVGLALGFAIEFLAPTREPQLFSHEGT